MKYIFSLLLLGVLHSAYAQDELIEDVVTTQSELVIDSDIYHLDAVDDSCAGIGNCTVIANLVMKMLDMRLVMFS